VSDDTDEFTEDKLRSMAAGLALMEAERQVFADGGAVDDEGEDGAREHDARHRRPSIDARTERLTGTPSAFCEMDVLEIRLDGR
jgi:hypothetical protein